MWQSTRKMAEAITEGILSEDSNVTVKLYNAAKEDKNDILTEMFQSKAVLVGLQPSTMAILMRLRVFLKWLAV